MKTVAAALLVAALLASASAWHLAATALSRAAAVEACVYHFVCPGADKQ